MTSSSSSEKVFSGAELTKGGFAKAPDHLKNVIILLHEAGLNYVLEEPCRVLNAEVEQFFDNARIDEQQGKLRSKVNGVKIKMTSLFLNRFLRMPTDDTEESITGEDTDRALAWCDYQGKKASALKKNAMNEEARFLADIIGKVFMCKPGSHDHISGGMFELMTAVVLRKKRNWGADLFRFIAGSLSKPSFGRIISLFICQYHPDNFSMSKGMPLHHHKKINMLTLDRVKRKIPQDWRKAPKDKPVDEQVPADNEGLGEHEVEHLDEVSARIIATDGNIEPHVPSQEEEHGIPQDTSQICEDMPAQSEGEARQHVISEEIHLGTFIDRDMELEIDRIRLKGSNVASTSTPVVQDNSQLLSSIAKMLDDKKRDIILEQKKMVDEVAATYNKRLSEIKDYVKITLDKFGDNLDHLNTLVFKLQDKHGKAVPEEEEPRVEANRVLQEAFERTQVEKAKAKMQEEVPPQQSCDATTSYVNKKRKGSAETKVYKRRKHLDRKLT